MHLHLAFELPCGGGLRVLSESEITLPLIKTLYCLPIVKDISIVLLIFYTAPTQRKFELKSVTQLSSALCHQLTIKIAVKLKFSLCENFLKD